MPTRRQNVLQQISGSEFNVVILTTLFCAAPYAHTGETLCHGTPGHANVLLAAAD
jgi:hypothetical protein